MDSGKYPFCHISLSHDKFKEELEQKAVVGVVYIVANDYQGQNEGLPPLPNCKIDSGNMELFFDTCEDKYHVISELNVKSKEFWDTCNYLANSDYPLCCDRIIIYFAGHGGHLEKQQYIVMHKDYPSEENTTKTSDSENKIDLNTLLFIFRKRKKKEMTIILLLDACCDAENVKCNKNELVASAGSHRTLARGNCANGGFWTHAFLMVFHNAAKGEIDIVKLLKGVNDWMGEKCYDKNSEHLTLYPACTPEKYLTRKIWFRKRISYRNMPPTNAFRHFCETLFVELKKIEFQKLQRAYLQSIHPVPGVSLTENLKMSIQATNNPDDLFNLIFSNMEYICNWIDIRILKKISDGCSSAIEVIDQYEKEMYSKKLIVHHIPNLNIPADEFKCFTKIEETWNKDIAGITIKDFVQHWKDIEELLNVEESLLLHKVTHDCKLIKIVWLLCNDLVERVNVSVEQDDLLLTEVLYLRIGNDIIMERPSDDHDNQKNYVKCVIGEDVFQCIKTKYEKLLKDLQEKFIEFDIYPARILIGLRVNDDNNVSAFSSEFIKDVLKNPEIAMDILFSQISDSIRYFDCEMLEAYVRGSECTDATDLFDKYYEEIGNCLLADCVLISEHQADNCKAEGKTRIFKIKCEEKKIEVKKWNLIKKALNKCCKSPMATFHLNNVTRGCLTFICEISLQAKSYLLQLKITQHQLKPLATMKIACLIIDDEWELKVPLECNNEDVVSWTKIIADPVPETVPTKNDDELTEVKEFTSTEETTTNKSEAEEGSTLHMETPSFLQKKLTWSDSAAVGTLFGQNIEVMAEENTEDLSDLNLMPKEMPSDFPEKETVAKPIDSTAKHTYSESSLTSPVQDTSPCTDDYQTALFEFLSERRSLEYFTANSPGLEETRVTA